MLSKSIYICSSNYNCICFNLLVFLTRAMHGVREFGDTILLTNIQKRKLYNKSSLNNFFSFKKYIFINFIIKILNIILVKLKTLGKNIVVKIITPLVLYIGHFQPNHKD